MPRIACLATLITPRRKLGKRPAARGSIHGPWTLRRVLPCIQRNQPYQESGHPRFLQLDLYSHGIPTLRPCIGNMAKMWSIWALTMLVSTAVAWNNGSKWIPGPTHGTDALASQGLANLAFYQAAHRTNTSTNCTLETASRRQEWDSLTRQQKLAYISAVQCMSTLPSLSNPVDVPGARNRIDDFTVTHLNLTNYVHGSVQCTPHPNAIVAHSLTGQSVGLVPPLAPLFPLEMGDRPARGM